MRFRPGLRSKMLAFTFGVVALLVGLSLAVIHRFVARQVQAAFTLFSANDELNVAAEAEGLQVENLNLRP